MIKNKIEFVASFAAAVVLLILSLINPWVGVGFGFVYLLIDPIYTLFKK